VILPFLLAAWLAPAAPAAAQEGPRAFVARLYAAYRDPDFSPLRRPERIFAPPFVAALAEDRRLFTGEVGFIDADPICQCQDPGGMKADLGAVREAGARAEVSVRLRFGAADVRRIRLKLVRLAAGWRVADIAADDEPSFLADLQASNRKERQKRRGRR